MDVHNKLKEHFLKNNIHFEVLSHSPGATAEEYHNAVGCRYEQQAKCLLLRVKDSKEKYYTLVVIPAQKRLNLDEIKKVLFANEIRMANKDELFIVTGCNFGEVPPVGSIFNIRIAMDRDLHECRKS